MKSFMKAKGADWKSTYLLKSTQYGRDSVVQRFTKPWPMLDFTYYK